MLTDQKSSPVNTFFPIGLKTTRSPQHLWHILPDRNKMPPIKNDGRASNGKNHKQLGLPLDMEEFGKVFEVYSSHQEKNIDQSQKSDRENCQTCGRSDTCGMVVRSSGKLIEQGNSVWGKETGSAYKV